MQGAAIKSAGEQGNWKAESAESFDANLTRWDSAHILNYPGGKLVTFTRHLPWAFYLIHESGEGGGSKHYLFLLILSWCSFVAVEKASAPDSIYELQNTAHQRHSGVLLTWYRFGIT